jgi:ribonuclease D
VAERVGIDTEFHGERSYIPRLMLVQVATEEHIYLVDPLANLDLLPVFELLAAPSPLVIGHALHNDLEIVYLRYGLRLKGVFDTQIGGAFLGHGLQAGLATLLRTILDVRLPKDGQMSDWSRRPLPSRQLNYAANDVRHLLEVHDHMSGELERLHRQPWVEQECALLGADGRYERDGETAFRKVSGARGLRHPQTGILVELAAERERIAAELDRIPHHMMSDDLLMALCRAAPKDREALNGDRRFRNRQLHRNADRLLAAIARGRQRKVARPLRRKTAGPGGETVSALVMLLVGRVAEQHNLAPQLLLRRKTVLSALAEDPTDRESMATALGLRGWRAELLANQIWELLNGRCSARCGRDRHGLHVEFGVDE